MRKIQVFEFSEGRGMYTKGTRDFEKAVLAMRGYAMHEQALDPEAWSDNPNQSYDPKTVTKETVKEMRYWTCKDCGISTIGDENICIECNDPIRGVGRLTFAFLQKTNMKTEMDQLKENADREFARQRLIEVAEYLKETHLEATRCLYWVGRALYTETAALILYLGLIAYSIFGGVDHDFMDEILEWAFILVVITQYRGWYWRCLFNKADGERDGILNTLRLLKMLDEEDDGDKSVKKVKKVSLFARFKEFYERMGSKKTDEAYA